MYVKGGRPWGLVVVVGVGPKKAKRKERIIRVSYLTRILLY